MKPAAFIIPTSNEACHLHYSHRHPPLQYDLLIVQDGEVVGLSKPVALSHSVEAWLGQLSPAMVVSLQQLLAEAVAAGKGVDPNGFPSQVLCVSEQVQFTANVEAAFARGSLAPVLAQLQARLRLVSCCQNCLNCADVCRRSWRRTLRWSTTRQRQCWSSRSRR